MANVPEEWRWTETHGQRLRQARIRKGLSQKAATGVLGVSDDTLRNWESGLTQPREGSLAAIAEFCDISLAELVGLEPEVPQSEAAEVVPEPSSAYRPADRRGPRWRRSVVMIAIGAAAALALAIGYSRATGRFHELRPAQDGIEAISRSGQVLWRARGVEPSTADRWVLVRAPGGRKLIACVLAPRGDYRPETVSKLSFLEPNAPQLKVVKTVQLPSSGWTQFPGYSRRYEMAYIDTVDLDGDGVDEILLTYQQVPECVSYTIVYDPVAGRARLLFVHTGAHHFTGAWDLDGDGQRELLFLGINNGYNWMNALAAIRVPPLRRGTLRDSDYPLISPDSASYTPRESDLMFYTLLPRGRVPDDTAAASWDAKRRVISVRLLNGRVVPVSAHGFLMNSVVAVPVAERAAFRRDAYRHNREARRLIRAGFAADGIAECRKAVQAAGRSGDAILLEAMERDLVKVLIRGGHDDEGETLALSVARDSENASEIYYDAAAAFHVAGQLRTAVKYYEAGIRSGGSPEAGKSKHEFIQGEVLALAELGEFEEAERAIEQFRARYVTGSEDWTAKYRAFVAWRKGEVPDITPIVVRSTATDLERYWILEFEHANGRDALGLLSAVDALLAEHNEPRGALLSLRATLLDRLGREREAEATILEAMLANTREAKNNIVARGHMQIIATRHAVFSAGAS